MPLPSPQPPIAPLNYCRSQCTPRPTFKLFENLESNNFVSLSVQLPPKLQHLVNNEIKRAADSTINTLYKINAVLNVETGKIK